MADHARKDRLEWARGLEPAIVWREFAALAAIPRRSKQEQAARLHVIARLEELGAAPQVDDVGNVVAAVPASSASRSAATVVLQAHLDMVCEADKSAGMDPAIDGVFPAVRDGWVQAQGTSLGADDGIGVAVALAIAAEAAQDATGHPALPRPPLQLLFTVDEEEDFTGAAGVDPQRVTGRVLLNLDSEDEREVIIGSAGGSRVFLRVPIKWQAAPAGLRGIELRVGGLEGGHSGHRIDDNVMNALTALGYALARALDDVATGAANLFVAGLRGGRSDNAIPREARAVLAVDADGGQVLERAATATQERVRAWRAGADDNAVVEVVNADGPSPARVLSHAAARRAVDLLLALPSGVIAMDEQVPGTVRTSTSLGIAYVEGDDLVLVSAPRSSRPADLDALHARYASYARLAGAQLLVTSEYPAWQPDFVSPLLDVVRGAYAEVHGREPIVKVVHAGLEAGELAARLPGLTAVSIGPTVLGVHGPGERLEVASVARFHAVVRATLARLAGSPPA